MTMVDVSQKTNSDHRLAIIAGYGRLPIDVAEAARQNGQSPVILALEGEVDQDWSNFDHAKFSIGDFVRLKKLIADFNIDRIVLAGGVRKRPQISELRPTLNILFALPRLIKTIISGGDDAALRGFINLIESEGCKVIGAHEIVPGLLANEGSIGNLVPQKQDLIDIDIATKAAVKLGELDIGQGVVVVSGRVIALEGLEGTDAMLERVAGLRDAGRLPKSKNGVLVKLCKPNQEMRADLPTIGLGTIENAKNAGLSGVVVEAGRSIVLDRKELIEKADDLGIFVSGIIRSEH